MSVIKFIICLFYLNLPIISLAETLSEKSSDEWIQVDSIDDVHIFQNKAGMLDGIIPLQAKGKINATVSQILLVLSESDRRSEWLPRWREGKLQKKLSNVSRIESNVTRMPWPFKDREFTYQVDGEIDYIKEIIALNMKSVDFPKQYEDTVTGIMHKGLFKIEKIDENTSEFTMMFFSNPNGFIPNWIVNIAQKRWPYIFINSLRAHVAKRISEEPKKYKTFNVFKIPKQELSI
jgi:hypothetical protein